MRSNYSRLLSRRVKTAPLRHAIIGVAIILVIAPITSAATTDRRIKFRTGQTKARVKGRFTKSVSELYYIVGARSGQHMRVKITPVGKGLVTAGEVISPSGKLDGGPGGVIFDADLTESGDYRIRVF